MQYWKIKRMSVKTLERWLDSVDKLLLNYLGAEGLGMINCPLCWAECESCLWAIIERRSCALFRDELYPERDPPGVSSLRRHPTFEKCTKWKEARIKQLTHWRGIIVKELGGRYVKQEKSKKEKK